MDSKNSKHQWIAIGPEKFFRKKLNRIIILEEPVLLWKVGKTWKAFEDRCPHRSFPLSQGKIVNQKVQCPYHGWSFNHLGHLEKIPGLPLGHNLPKCSLREISCQVYDEILWLCLSKNSTTRPIENLIPDYRPEHSFWMNAGIDTDPVRAFENLLDGFHTPFIHSGLVRGKNRNRVTARLHRLEYSSEITYTGEKAQSGFLSRFFEPSRSKSIGRFLAPNIAQLEYWGDRLHFMLEAFARPINNIQTDFSIRISTHKGALPGWLKTLILKPILTRILRQDLRALEIQSQNTSPSNRHRLEEGPTDFMITEILRLTQANSDSLAKEEQFKVWRFDL